MKKQILITILMMASLLAWADDGDVFTAKTTEGIEITFKVISESEKTAQVGEGNFTSFTIKSGFDGQFDGQITIPSTISYNNTYYTVSKLSDYAFYNCGITITNIIIPSSVITIGAYCFYDCWDLSTLEIPNSIKHIGINAFEGTMWYNNQPDGLVYVGNVAYKYKGEMPKDTSISIKEGTASINTFAFRDCFGLSSIEIPGSVTDISHLSFFNCTGLSSIIVNSSNLIYDSRDNCNAIIEKATGKLIVGCKNSLIPQGVTSIGEGAFYYCYGLSSIEIPNSVECIDNSAFYGYPGLTSIEIPSSVNNIGTFAFYGCQLLQSISIKTISPPYLDGELDELASQEVYDNCTLYVPRNSINAYKESKTWGKFKNIEIIKYKLIYLVDGSEYKIDYFEEGTPLNIESLSKEGYTFSGWSEIPETMPDHDVTITGSFVINKYKVTYIVDGTEYKTEDVEYGSVLKPNTPTKEGYTFSGWKNMPNTMPAHDVTVTGSFSINSYTLTYIVDGAEYKTASVEYGSVITPEVAPTKEGYTFNGWSEIPETMPAHDVKVTGTFSINKYEVTYMIDGVEYKKEVVEYGSEIKPDTLSKEGYSFSWIDLPKTMPAHDIIINGSFTINQYKVKFTVDGTEYQTIEVDYGADVNPIEEPTKIGYTFSGWSDIPDTMPAHDVVINGNFSVNYYTISYVVNDNIYMTDSVAYGTEAIPIDGPEREGYTFIGWTGFPTTMPAHDVIAIGFYTVNSYKVTFVYGDSVLTTIEVKYGEAIDLPTSLNSERYTLVEWKDVPDTMPAHDITIYADYVDGINTITADRKDEQYIRMNGMYTPDLKPGLNIIRMKDGTTKKVWVK